MTKINCRFFFKFFVRFWSSWGACAKYFMGWTCQNALKNIKITYYESQKMYGENLKCFWFRSSLIHWTKYSITLNHQNGLDKPQNSKTAVDFLLSYLIHIELGEREREREREMNLLPNWKYIYELKLKLKCMVSSTQYECRTLYELLDSVEVVKIVPKVHTTKPSLALWCANFLSKFVFVWGGEGTCPLPPGPPRTAYAY